MIGVRLIGGLTLPRMRTAAAAPPLPWLVGGVLAVAWFGYGWLRLATLRSQAYDLAFFDQVVWNLSRGHGFASSFIPYSFLGQHFSPALTLFVPLYWVAPSPLWLLVGQALALGLAAVPLHALARIWLDDSKAWAVVIAYALQVGIARAVGYDFHTESLAVPFVFVALLASAMGRWPIFWLAALAPILTKEDGTLVAFGIGALVALTASRRAGVGLMALSAGLALLLAFVVMPGLRDGQSADLAGRYSYLAGGVSHAVDGAFNRITDPAAPIAVLALLAGVGFLPLVRPAAVLAAVPALGLAILSSNAYQHQLLLQYSLPSTPLLLAAAMLGWRRLKDAGPALGAAGLGLLLAGATAMQVILSPLTGPVGIRAQGFLDFPRAARAAAAAADVPPGRPVAAGPDVLPLLAERPVIAQLPGSNDLEWLVTDGNRSLPWRPATAGYRVVAVEGEFTVWRRQP